MIEFLGELVGDESVGSVAIVRSMSWEPESKNLTGVFEEGEAQAKDRAVSKSGFARSYRDSRDGSESP